MRVKGLGFRVSGVSDFGCLGFWVFRVSGCLVLWVFTVLVFRIQGVSGFGCVSGFLGRLLIKQAVQGGGRSGHSPSPHSTLSLQPYNPTPLTLPFL